MVTLWLLIAAMAGAMGQEREANFQIRFEPTAKLQTGAPIPFEIKVQNALRKPVSHAKVKLQIEQGNAATVETFAATEVEAGMYIAKPVFRRAGEWNVYVEVNREGATSARTIAFQVAE